MNYDVVVLGGGSGGIAAALAASRAGASAVVIERRASFGGEATNSGVNTYCGFYTRGENPDLVIGGIGKEVLDRVEAMGGNVKPTISSSTGNYSVRIDPELVKVALDDLLSESEAAYLLHAYAYDVVCENGHISAVLCSDDSGKFRVNGKVFIDASGDGNLLNMAGIETQWGDETGDTQLASLPIRFENVPVNFDISMKTMAEAIQKARADGKEPMKKDRGLILKAPADTFGYCTTPAYYVGSLDAETLTKAEMNLRKQSRNYLYAFKTYVPGLENIYISTTGPNIGIRESRKIIGEIKLSGDDVMNAVKREDSIGRGGWSPDIHRAGDPVFLKIADNEYYSIPLGCLKVKAADNVWGCGRLACGDGVAHASMRVMGTSFVTGQAAGVAAALQSSTGKAELKYVQAELLRQGALL